MARQKMLYQVAGQWGRQKMPEEKVKEWQRKEKESRVYLGARLVAGVCYPRMQEAKAAGLKFEPNLGNLVGLFLKNRKKQNKKICRCAKALSSSASTKKVHLSRLCLRFPGVAVRKSHIFRSHIFRNYHTDFILNPWTQMTKQFNKKMRAARCGDTAQAEGLISI